MFSVVCFFTVHEHSQKGCIFLHLESLKKVIVADTFGKAVALGFGAVGTLSSMEALIVSLSYTFQLFFDFSGYCDMAMGIGYLFNIELPINFNSPYKATSIVEFWERWHISLTRFLRTYIYIPLGVNRKRKIRTYLNIMIIYLVSGIWRGADWTFILWGLLHWILNCLNRLLKKPWEKLEMCCLSSFSVREEFYSCFRLIEFTVIEAEIGFLNYLPSRIVGFHLWMFILGAFFIVLNFRNSREIIFKPTVAKSLVTVIFMLWSVISFSGISIFLYFVF